MMLSPHSATTSLRQLLDQQRCGPARSSADAATGDHQGIQFGQIFLQYFLSCTRLAVHDRPRSSLLRELFMTRTCEL